MSEDAATLGAPAGMRAMVRRDKGDSTTLGGALCEAGEAVTEPAAREAGRHPDSAPRANPKSIEEMAAVNGYRSAAV